MGKDALHDKLLAQMEALWKARGLTQEAAVTQQTWNTWQRGTSPRLDTLAKYVRRLDGELRIDIVDKLAAEPPSLPIHVSPESVEIAGLVDRLRPDERRAMLETVHNMARTFHALRPPAVEKAKK